MSCTTNELIHIEFKKQLLALIKKELFTNYSKHFFMPDEQPNSQS